MLWPAEKQQHPKVRSREWRSPSPAAQKHPAFIPCTSSAFWLISGCYDLSTCDIGSKKSRRTKTFTSPDLTQPLNMSKQILFTLLLLRLQDESPEQLSWKRFSVTKYPQYQGFYYCCGPMLAIHLFLCLCDVSFDCTMHTFCIIHAQPHLSHQQHQQHDACLPVRHPTDCLTENSISVWSI